MRKVFVCGGAGYIGSHVVQALIEKTKFQVIVVDTLAATKGYSGHLPKEIEIVKGDLRDVAFLDEAFAKHKPDAVVHLCAKIIVPESVADPLEYYDANVVSSIRLLQAMKNHGCKNIVFSSTAALFGTPAKPGPIEPDATIQPESPYGDTKHAVEAIMRSCDHAYGIKNVSLRYFNAAGAHTSGRIGETHDPESHLIPIVLQVALGQRENISIFGTDYPTPDGTCVRDYIHVSDLASAHVLAVEHLFNAGASTSYNLGNGQGYSVRQVIEVARKVTGHEIPTVERERREGDPPVLVAASQRVREELKWNPEFPSLEQIISTAWNFHKAHPRGYSEQK